MRFDHAKVLQRVMPHCAAQCHSSLLCLLAACRFGWIVRRLPLPCDSWRAMVVTRLPLRCNVDACTTCAVCRTSPPLKRKTDARVHSRRGTPPCVLLRCVFALQCGARAVSLCFLDSLTRGTCVALKSLSLLRAAFLFRRVAPPPMSRRLHYGCVIT
jgi:hypothetical protein